MPDFLGGVIGFGAIFGLFFMWQHLDVLSDGNVGGD